jgi:hypothetical protein
VKPTVELVYFKGCPHVEAARQALRSALAAMEYTPEWEEWDQESPQAPARVRGWGSPTVLIGGRDVRGGGGGVGGLACRADGPPSIEEICWALAEDVAAGG